MSHVEQIRNYVYTALTSQYDQAFAQEGIHHLTTVAAIAGALALQAQEDSDLCQIAGYLHDLSFYQTHYHPNHAAKSAQLAQSILREKTTLNQADVAIIVQAIAHHSDKNIRHDPLDEILKNADTIAHTLADGSTHLKSVEQQRLKQWLQNDK